MDSLGMFLFMLIGLLNGIIASLMVFFRLKSNPFLKWMAFAIFLFCLSTIREFLHFFETTINFRPPFTNLFYFKLFIPAILILAAEVNYSKKKNILFIPGSISFLLMFFFNFSVLSRFIFVGDFVPIATDCLAFLWVLIYYYKNSGTLAKNKPLSIYFKLFLIVFLVVFLTRVFQLVAILSASEWFYDLVFSFRVISISILVYILSLVLLSHLLKSKKKNKSLLSGFLKQEDTKVIDGIPKNELLLKLDDLMIKKQLFKNPKLKSINVAEKLDISVHQLSELLNTHLDKNFSSVINEHRVNHAIKLLKTDSNYTIEAIGYESGFNSKSAFYKAFKKMTGKSPSNYLSG